MPSASETRAERQILLVGPYGVLGTGVVDAVTVNPEWGITTAARRRRARQLTRLRDLRIIP